MESRLDKATLAQVNLALAGEQAVAQDRLGCLEPATLHRVATMGVHHLDDVFRVREDIEVLAHDANMCQSGMVDNEIIEEAQNVSTTKESTDEADPRGTPWTADVPTAILRNGDVAVGDSFGCDLSLVADGDMGRRHMSSVARRMRSRHLDCGSETMGRVNTGHLAVGIESGAESSSLSPVHRSRRARMAVMDQPAPAVVPSLADVQDAAELLAPIIRRIPLTSARWLSERVGGPVFLAPENLQRAGSFKIRGAYTRISRLGDEARVRGVVAASAGNHAQGVALAAQLLGVPATVFMPEGASIPKVTATRAYGADVHFAGSTIEQTIIAAERFAEETGAILIHPFDHADVVAGQGTLGLEILEALPEVGTIVVCTGGGGLLAGIALAVKSARPDVQVIGAQASGAAAYPPSLAAGSPVALGSMRTMADGIAVGRPGDVPFALIDTYVDGIRTVSEDSLARAQLLMLERSKLVVEPGGAAAVAAILDDPRSFTSPVVATLSGGNVDPLLLMRVIRHGLTAAGRFTTLTVRMPDRPGALAGLLTDISSHDANVVDVRHTRTDPRLAVDEVEIAVELETRGPDHRDDVVATLRERGYFVVN